jgi:hypothetical protein
MNVIGRREYYHIESLSHRVKWGFFCGEMLRYPDRYPHDKRLIFDANRAQVLVEMARPAALRTKTTP